jgi:uncharacterized protein (DUF1499 family)
MVHQMGVDAQGWLKRLFMLFACAFLLANCSGTQAMKTGLDKGKLRPCSASPNCVSSQSSDQDHFIEPLTYQDSRAQARDRLIAVIQAMDRARIIELEDDYLHAEFSSALFRFVDDVEFHLPADAKVIEVRSASRLGYYDFGVNRRRLERIRAEFDK